MASGSRRKAENLRTDSERALTRGDRHTHRRNHGGDSPRMPRGERRNLLRTTFKPAKFRNQNVFTAGRNYGILTVSKRNGVMAMAQNPIFLSRLEFKMRHDDAQLLDRIAQQRGCSTSELIRRALYEAIPSLATRQREREMIAAQEVAERQKLREWNAHAGPKEQ